MTGRRLWTLEEVRGELRAALDIVAELDPPADLRVLTLQAAIQMVTQRQVDPAGLAAMIPGLRA